MIEFRDLQISDRESVSKVFFNLNHRISEYCFGDIFIWRHIFKTKIAFENGAVLIEFHLDGRPVFLYPAGGGPQLIRSLYRSAREKNNEFRLFGLTAETKKQLEQDFPGKFEYSANRNWFDYIYDAEKLVSLSGRKYHSKRNHLARFQKLGLWSYEPVTHGSIGEAADMCAKWFELNSADGNQSLEQEKTAVSEAFKHFFDLGLDGGMLKLDGKTVAFTMGQKICADTYLVMIEKAYADVEGAYTAMNREFAAHVCAGLKFINREDDAGVEGLRKAKLSYYPEIIAEKNLAVLKKGETLD